MNTSIIELLDQFTSINKRHICMRPTARADSETARSGKTRHPEGPRNPEAKIRYSFRPARNFWSAIRRPFPTASELPGNDRKRWNLDGRIVLASASGSPQGSRSRPEALSVSIAKRFRIARSFSRPLRGHREALDSFRETGFS